MAKSALEKLNEDKQPQIRTKLPPGVRAWAKGDPNATMVIATPKEVDSILKRVPKGKLITIDEVRAYLAHVHGTTIACPLTTGIFISISAQAAEEMRAQGRKRVTPYWRALKSGGELNDRLPGGMAAQRARLAAEGFEVIARGKRLFVKDFARYIYRPR